MKINSVYFNHRLVIVLYWMEFFENSFDLILYNSAMYISIFSYVQRLKFGKLGVLVVSNIRNNSPILALFLFSTCVYIIFSSSAPFLNFEIPSLSRNKKLERKYQILFGIRIEINNNWYLIFFFRACFMIFNIYYWMVICFKIYIYETDWILFSLNLNVILLPLHS